MTMPTNRASERSSSTPGPRKSAPTASTAAIGSRPMTVVLIERTSVWLTARLAAWAKVIRPLANASLGVLAHLVEDDDGVVEAVAEDGEEADHRRRRDLEPD